MTEGPPKASPFRDRRAENRDKLKEVIFSQLVAAKVLENFHDDLYDTDLAEESIDEIVTTFESLTEENKRRVLAIPAQLRKQQFKRYANLIHEEKMTPAGVVLDILEKASKNGFSIGFHLSPRNIKPEKDGSWVIRGKEKDHRHNDTPMAYYSYDYANRYLKKPVQFMYVIRSEDGPTSSHHRDNDGTWGHAPFLSIIDQIDMKKLETEMEERLQSLRAPEEK